MIFFSIFADLSAEAAALWKQDYVNSELEYQDEIFFIQFVSSIQTVPVYLMHFQTNFESEMQCWNM